MIRPNSRAHAAAIAVAVLEAAALATGLALGAMLGGTTGRDLGADAAEAAFAHAVPLLIVAEILKFLIAIAQIVVVRAVAAAAQARTTRRAALGAGIAGALLVAASGALGLYAIAAADPALGSMIASIGFAGLAATGLFALVLLGFEAPRLRRWHAGATLAFALASLAAPFYAPLALLTVPLGWAFWLGLAGRLRPR